MGDLDLPGPPRQVHCLFRIRVKKRRKKPTSEIADASMLPIVFAARGVVPFNAQPYTAGSSDLTAVSDSAERSIVGSSLADICRHFGYF